MRFELVRERIVALPRRLPDAPPILTPIRLDTGEAPVGMAAAARERGRPAAVLVLLFPDEEGEARVLLTVRVRHLAAHAGEVSFPGGSAEEGDRDPIDTALRESCEEVGLDPDECGLEVAGVLETFALTVSGFSIHPVVALARRVPATRPNPDEVARVVLAPVESFLPDAPVELEERTIRERLIRFGVYPVDGERIWGATARMLGQLGAALALPAEPARPEFGREVAPGVEPATPPEPGIRAAARTDMPSIERFLDVLAPELARDLPPAAELLVATVGEEVAGVAGWAAWDRDRDEDDPRGFDGVAFPDGRPAAELTLLAVAPTLRGRGIGRRLVEVVAEAAARRGHARLLGWTSSDADGHPSSRTARAFFRGNGFADLAVDRRLRALGEDRLLLARPLDPLALGVPPSSSPD